MRLRCKAPWWKKRERLGHAQFIPRQQRQVWQVYGSILCMGKLWARSQYKTHNDSHGLRIWWPLYMPKYWRPQLPKVEVDNITCSRPKVLGYMQTASFWRPTVKRKLKSVYLLIKKTTKYLLGHLLKNLPSHAFEGNNFSINYFLQKSYRYFCFS